MQLAEAIERLDTVISTTRSPDAATATISRALAASAALTSFLAAQEAELVRMLRAVPGSFPEATIADATRCSLNDASRQTDRAATLGHADAMADALSDGAIAPGHVDALTRAGRQLDDQQRAELFDQHEQLAADASATTVGDFNDLLKKKVKDLRRESGEERLGRQRRNTRLRTWTDGQDMFRIAGAFDPLTGSELADRLRDAVASMRAAGIPDTAPSDRLEQQQHLDGVALAHLVLRRDGGTAGDADSHPDHGVTGAHGQPADGAPHASTPSDAPTSPSPISLPERSRRDAIVVVDATQVTADGEPVIDHGIPAELPASVMCEVFGVESPDVIVVANGVVLHAPGRLDLGRSTRLANRAQRRALRGLYATCAVPGCSVHFDRCKLHHVVWWRNGGRTDLDNLLPVCQHHHTRLHDDRWQVSLGQHRELTIRFQDGQVMRTGAPKRSAA